MAGGGGGRSTPQTTTQTSEPWDVQKGYLTDGFQIARQQLEREAAGGGPAFFPGATYTDADWKTNAATNALFTRGQNGMTGDDTLRGVAGSLTSDGGAGLDGARTLAWLRDGDMGNAGGLAWAQAGPERRASWLQGADTIGNTAAGGMLGRNPEFDAMVSRAVEAARPSVDAAFAGTGRLGSGAHAAAFADAATRTAGDLAYQDYGRERGLQEQAAATMAGLDAGQAGQRLAATQLFGQMESGARDRALQAASTSTDRDLAARGLGFSGLGQAANADYQDINAMFQAGQTTEGYANQALQDQINRWNYNQNLPRDQLATYMGLVQGNYGGTSTLTQPVYRQSSLTQGLGLGLQGLGTAASLASMFSDRRLKTAIQRIGTWFNGLPVYRFRYIWGGPEHVGFMAQDVARLRPQAVQRHPSGFLLVDYAKAAA